MEDFLQTGGVNHTLSFSFSSISSFYMPHAPWGMIAPRKLRPMSSFCRPSEKPEVALRSFGFSPWNILKHQYHCHRKCKNLGSLQGCQSLLSSCYELRTALILVAEAMRSRIALRADVGRTPDIGIVHKWCIVMFFHGTKQNKSGTGNGDGMWWIGWQKTPFPVFLVTRLQGYIFTSVIPTQTFIFCHYWEGGPHPNG